ncbi:hypothetical protein MHYP_G00195020 [Metynnis hypsauchen]
MCSEAEPKPCDERGEEAARKEGLQLNPEMTAIPHIMRSEGRGTRICRKLASGLYLHRAISSSAASRLLEAVLLTGPAPFLPHSLVAILLDAFTPSASCR